VHRPFVFVDVGAPLQLLTERPLWWCSVMKISSRAMEGLEVLTRNSTRLQVESRIASLTPSTARTFFRALCLASSSLKASFSLTTMSVFLWE